MTSSRRENSGEVLSDSDNELTEQMHTSTDDQKSTTFDSPGPQLKDPVFDFSDWSPEAPAGLQFLCLIPMMSGYEAKYAQSEPGRKMKVSSKHRQQRLKLCRRKSGFSIGGDLTDEKKLRQAAGKKDYATVIELLESGVDPSCHDDKKRTPLHMAASQGNESIVKALLDFGGDPNKTDILGNTPLHLAACTIASHVSVITLLLKAGTNLQAVDRCGRTPLSFAKSRLRVVMQQQSAGSDQMKKDITQVIEMMREYLRMSGMTDDACQLDSLCAQLNKSTTLEEVNGFNNLLAEFTSLTLQKKSSSLS